MVVLETRTLLLMLSTRTTTISLSVGLFLKGKLLWSVGLEDFLLQEELRTSLELTLVVVALFNPVDTVRSEEVEIALLREKERRMKS